jgi:hypothetical protein
MAWRKALFACYAMPAIAVLLCLVVILLAVYALAMLIIVPGNALKKWAGLATCLRAIDGPSALPDFGGNHQADL